MRDKDFLVISLRTEARRGKQGISNNWEKKSISY